MRIAIAMIMLWVLFVSPAAASGQYTERWFTPVAAEGTRVLWSSYAAASKRYRLVELNRGRLRSLKVEGKRAPFDLDIGRDANGVAVVTYSRCRREPSVSRSSVPTREWSTARECRLWEYNLSSHRERRLSVDVPEGYSAYLPSRWGSSVTAVLRRDRQGAAARLSRARVGGRLATLDRERRPARAVPADSLDLVGPIATDMRGTRSVAVQVSDSGECERPRGDADRTSEALEAEVILYDSRSRRRAVTETCTYAERPAVVDAFLTSSGVYWATSLRVELEPGRYTSSLANSTGATPLPDNTVSAGRLEGSAVASTYRRGRSVVSIIPEK